MNKLTTKRQMLHMLSLLPDIDAVEAEYGPLHLLDVEELEEECRALLAVDPLLYSKTPLPVHLFSHEKRAPKPNPLTIRPRLSCVNMSVHRLRWLRTWYVPLSDTIVSLKQTAQQARDFLVPILTEMDTDVRKEFFIECLMVAEEQSFQWPHAFFFLLCFFLQDTQFYPDRLWHMQQVSSAVYRHNVCVALVLMHLKRPCAWIYDPSIAMKLVKMNSAFWLSILMDACRPYHLMFYADVFRPECMAYALQTECDEYLRWLKTMPDPNPFIWTLWNTVIEHDLQDCIPFLTKHLTVTPNLSMCVHLIRRCVDTQNVLCMFHVLQWILNTVGPQIQMFHVLVWRSFPMRDTSNPCIVCLHKTFSWKNQDPLDWKHYLKTTVCALHYMSMQEKRMAEGGKGPMSEGGKEPTPRKSSL